jgi:hypothetical protein
MLLRPIQGEQGLLVWSHLEGSAIFGPRDNFNIKIPMGLEGLFIRDKQLGDPGAMTKRYPILLPRTAVEAKNTQKQG